jgi:hypothetical protein
MSLPGERADPNRGLRPKRWGLGTGMRLFLAALALRAFLLAVLFLLRGETWTHFISTSDAGSFIAVAKVVYGMSPAGSLSVYDTRVFTGWPLAFGWALRMGLPDPAVLIVSCCLAALVPVLFLWLTGDRALSWYLVYFPPAWLLASTHPISEPAYLAVVLLGLIAVKRARPGMAGALGGGTVLVRAFGVAWLAGLFLALARRGRLASRAPWAFAIAAAVPVAGLLVLNGMIYGHPLQQVHTYGRPLAELNIPPGISRDLGNPSGHWGWPFEHLLLTPWRTHVPLWKSAYIYAHVPVLLLLVWRAVASLRSKPPGEDWEAALVLGFLLNAALIVCAGPYWGFESFDRYFVWGLPGALWLSRGWLAGRPKWHFLLFPVSVALSLRALLGHTG